MGKGLYAHSPYSCNKAVSVARNPSKNTSTGVQKDFLLINITTGG
jgi:hypothetical protein